jgi:hypothetical protein
MRRLILVVTLVAAFSIGLVSSASAAGPSSNCTGGYASTYGGPEFGPFVAESAHGFHELGTSLGQGAIGPASRGNTCEL